VVFTVGRGGGGAIFFSFSIFFPSQSADRTHCRHVAVTARAVRRLALGRVTVAVVVVQPSSSSSGRRARFLPLLASAVL